MSKYTKIHITTFALWCLMVAIHAARFVLGWFSESGAPQETLTTLFKACIFIAIFFPLWFFYGLTFMLFIAGRILKYLEKEGDS